MIRREIKLLPVERDSMSGQANQNQIKRVNLKKYYFGLTILIGLLVSSFGVFFFYHYLDTRSDVVRELEGLNKKQALVDAISSNRLDIFRNTELFLLDPTIGYYDEITFERIDVAADKSQQLMDLTSSQQQAAATLAGQLVDDFNLLRTNTIELFRSRLNINTQFPGLALANSEMIEPQRSADVLFDLLIDEIVGGELEPRNDELLGLLLKTQKLWQKQSSEYRIYLTNRFATFSTEFLQIQARTIENYRLKFFAHLQLMENLYSNEDSFEGNEHIQAIKASVNEWHAVFSKVREIHESEIWRTDNAILKQKIIPVMEGISSSLEDLNELFIEQEKNLNLRFERITSEVFTLLAGVIVLFVLFVVGIIFSLNRSVSKPIELVSRALQSRAVNAYSPVPEKGRSREIATLIEAFQDMDERINQRQSEINQLSAWQLAILDSAEYSIISTDTEGVIATFNRRAEELLGYKPEEMIGKQTPAIIHDPEEVMGYSEVLSHELGEEIEPGFEVFVAKGRRGYIDEREWTYIHKDGSRVPVYLSVTAIRGTDNEIIGFLGTAFDLSERNAIQKNLHESEARYKKLFSSASDAILLLGAGVGIIECNPATLDILGCSQDEIVNSPVLRFSPDLQPDGKSSRQKSLEKISAALKGEHQFFEWRHLRFDGTPFDAEVSLDAVTIGNEPHILATIRDITERKQLQEQLAYQAGHDSLTGLPNRKTLHDSFSRYQQAADESGKFVGMLLLDLDRFKEINDTLGHHLGDKVLAQVGPRLMKVCQDTSTTIARLGGDEFAVLVETEQSFEQIPELAKGFIQALKDPFEVTGIKASIGASVGVAYYPQHGKDSHELLRAADVAMYDAKRRSLGIKLYDTSIDDYSKQRLNFAAELAQAGEQDQLILHYQPKINIATGEVCGFEALVRWDHPQAGLLYPDSFIDLVEMSEVIHSFTHAVINLAVKDKKKLHELGFKQPVAINLSARNLLDDNCYKGLESALASHNLSTREVELEITESSVMQDPERAKAILNDFHKRGVNIAIDDFGTGYSSLSYLRQLPVNALKIDRTFVMNMTNDTQDSAIVRSTIALAHSLDLKVIAEGVEDEKILGILSVMDCDQAQGYGICRPQPFDQMVEWLTTGRRKLKVVDV